MTKKGRKKDYGNILATSFVKNYLNVWTNNQENKYDPKIISLLLLAEGNSLVQIIISNDEIYNGIYHIKTFKFSDSEEPKLIVGKLEDVHHPRKYTFEELIKQLPELQEKFDIKIPNGLNLNTHPLNKSIELPKLILG